MEFLSFTDIPTIFLITGIIASIFFLIQPAAYLIAPRIPGIGYLTAGKALAGFGVILTLTRGVFPVFASIVLANLAILSGFCLIYSGIVIHNGKKIKPTKLCLVLNSVFIPLFLYFTYINESIVIRTLIYSIFTGTVILLIAFKASLSFKAKNTTRWTYASIMMLHGVYYFFLAYMIYTGDEAADILSGGILIRETLLESIIFIFTISIAFVLMLARYLSEENINMAEKDSLTGILNRRIFSMMAERERLRSIRYNYTYSLIILDIDHFKEVNDNYGHALGDLALKYLAKHILQLLRKSDIVGRLGGDEFIIMLPETDEFHARILAEKILSAIRKIELPVNNGMIRLSASIGISSNKRRLDTLDETIIKADSALYKSKKTGRDKTTVFVPENISILN